MPIPTKPGAYQIVAGPVACLDDKPSGPIWSWSGSSRFFTPDDCAQIWHNYEFVRLVPETQRPREPTPVEVIREMGDGCPVWGNQTPIYTPDGARQAARQLCDAADYYDIRADLHKHIYEMEKFLSIVVPDTPRKAIVENAIRAAIDALLQDSGWSCKKEDLDAETERRYLGRVRD